MQVNGFFISSAQAASIAIAGAFSTGVNAATDAQAAPAAAQVHAQAPGVYR